MRVEERESLANQIKLSIFLCVDKFVTGIVTLMD